MLEDPGRVIVSSLLRLSQVDRPPDAVELGNRSDRLATRTRAHGVADLERGVLVRVAVAVDGQPLLAGAHLALELEPAERIPLLAELVVIEPAQPIELPPATFASRR